MSASISGLGTSNQVNAVDMASQEPALQSVVEIRWYPQNHMHLVIQREHCSVACGRLSVWNVGKTPRSHIAIQVPVTCEQRESLQRFIDSTAKERAIPLDTCSGSTAYILRKHTDLQIPKIVASFPACSTLYLLFQKILGNRKIGEVAYRGSGGECYNLLKSRVGPIFCLPIALSVEGYALLKLGCDCIHAIKTTSFSDMGRFFPVYLVSDLANYHFQYGAEEEAGISKNLDFNKTAELLLTLFLMVSLCTALTSITIGFLRK